MATLLNFGFAKPASKPSNETVDANQEENSSSWQLKGVSLHAG
jgi:hypothetical protein